MTTDIEKLDAHIHGHIPYVLLLLHYLEEWKIGHDGKPPNSYAEKKEFGKMVKAGAQTNNPEGGEENYDEAEAAVLKNLNIPSLSGSVREVFEYDPPLVSTYLQILCAII
jgi:amyloid beta precursor protein binding protein 1